MCIFSNSVQLGHVTFREGTVLLAEGKAFCSAGRQLEWGGGRRGHREAKEAASADSSWAQLSSVGGSNSGPLCAFGHWSAFFLILQHSQFWSMKLTNANVTSSDGLSSLERVSCNVIWSPFLISRYYLDLFIIPFALKWFKAIYKQGTKPSVSLQISVRSNYDKGHGWCSWVQSLPPHPHDGRGQATHHPVITTDSVFLKPFS